MRTPTQLTIRIPQLQAMSDAALALHRAGRTVPFERFQQTALEILQILIPFDSAWWGNASADPGEILQLHLHQCDSSILAAYAPFMEEDFMRAELMSQPGVTVNLADLTTRRALLKTRMYQQFGKRYHIEWSLGTVQVEPFSGLQEFLTLWRHDSGKPFSAVERQLKELLMPHLVESHRAARLRELLDGVDARNDQWAVIDRQGHLREACAGFVHSIRQQWPQWTTGRLPQLLRERVDEAAYYQASTWKLTATTRAELRFLQIAPLGATDRLSARERDIAQRFAQGASNTAIARALGLSPATIRNHLAHCYRKLAVNNKAELALRMTQGSPSLR